MGKGGTNKKFAPIPRHNSGQMTPKGIKKAAKITNCGRLVNLYGSFHSNTFPLEKLDSWISFYEKLAERPKHGQHYLQPLDCLKGLRRELRKAKADG